MYKLAENVTEEMLVKDHDFEPDWGWNENGRYIYYVDDTEQDNIIANVKTREVETNVCGWMGKQLHPRIKVKLESLIAKGLVVEC